MCIGNYAHKKNQIKGDRYIPTFTFGFSKKLMKEIQHQTEKHPEIFREFINLKKSLRLNKYLFL